MRPRLLNLTAPTGEDAYEVLLSVKSKIGALHELTGFLAEANVDVLSMHIQATRGRAADIVAFIEMRESKTGVEDLMQALRELEFVTEADAVKKAIARIEAR